MILPLQDIVVVAIEQAVAAPFATSRLADAGARVIKIERPEGDFARGYDDAALGQSSYFVWLNRGKESRALDLGQAEAKAELAELLAGADVMVQNLKPGALARLGFDAARLRRDYPQLICCSISGYGGSGPMAERKAYDLLIQAESGLCSLTGTGAEMSRVGISVVDIATGATAHAAILEALIRRGKTGQGDHIEISMFDVMADWLTVPLLNHLAGKTPQRNGLAHPSIAPYGVFNCRDGALVLIAVQSDREWRNLAAEFLGDAALGQAPAFLRNIDRVRNRADTDAAVRLAFARYDEAEALAALTRADVAFARVNDMAALARHPHLRQITVDSPAGALRYPAPAPIVNGAARAYGRVPDMPKPAEPRGPRDRPRQEP